MTIYQQDKKHCGYTFISLHPVQVPRWAFDLAPGIKTKLKKLSGEK